MSLAMKRPPDLSPELNWCEKHGGWDPRTGYRMCLGCASEIAYAELGASAFMMHPRDFSWYRNRVAMREAK